MRRRLLKAGVLAAASAGALVLAMPGGAVIRGTAVAPTPSWGPWAAYIVVSNNGSTTACSGSLVAPRRILTSAQCVAGTSLDGCSYAPQPYPAADFTVYVGNTNPTVSGTRYRVSSVSLNNNTATMIDGACLLQNDVALLQLTAPAKGNPLWIAPSEAAVTNGTNTELYGYGLTDLSNPKSYGSLQQTNPGDWTINIQCALASLIGAACLDQSGLSAGSPGDTGGPWTMNVDGKPVEAVVFSGYDLQHGFTYGTPVAQTATSTWLHRILGIPQLAPGSIVRDRTGGKAWLIDTQGYRRPIPDTATFTCLKGRHARVFNRSATTIRRMAARTITATCGPVSNILVVGTGDSGSAEPNDNLASLLTSAGYDVTESATLPADLSAFGQVWWMDTNPPSSDQQNQLVAYEHAGGGLFLTGERPCCEDLNSAETAMVNSMVIDGGITIGGQGDVCSCNDALPVNLNVLGSLSSRPFLVTSWTPSLPGGMLGVPDSSIFSYYQPGDIWSRQVTTAAWDRPSLVGGGRLVVFMDINWAEEAYRNPNWSSVAQNVALFLSGASNPPGPVVPQGSASRLASPLLAHPSAWGSSSATR